MKKIHYFFIATTLAFGTVSCHDDNNDNPTSEGDIEISISTADIQFKSSVVTDFGSNHEMNIYAKVSAQLDAEDLVTGVKASYDGNQWLMTPSIYVNPEKMSYNGKYAFLYAVSPYNEAYTDPANIPVDMNSQVDLMYSGGAAIATPKLPNVKLTMNHALSIMTFNIVPVNYSGNGTLKSIKIEGEDIYNSGTMNATTGKIKLGNVGPVTASANRTIEQGGWKSDLPGIWVLPFNTKANEVKIQFTIDNKTFDLIVPETEMKYGYQYIYRMVITDNGLEFDPSKTETRSLNQGNDTTPEFIGYGRIEIIASGNWMNTPFFTGDAVFGTISTPNQNISYQSAVKVEGLSAGNKVVAESWNSEGFEIETLDGIDTIDLSQYE